MIDTETIAQQLAEAREEIVRLTKERDDLRPTSDIVRVLRVIEYVGPRDKVERQVARSIHGTLVVPGTPEGISITGATVGDYPERLAIARATEENRDPKNKASRVGLDDIERNLLQVHRGARSDSDRQFLLDAVSALQHLRARQV